MNNRIIILGYKGMLGQMVNAYFSEQNFDVILFNNRFEQNTIKSFVEDLNQFNDSIIINCIGRIKQKSNDTLDLVWANSLLPLELASNLKKGHFLIQPSTDCVFSGDSKDFYNKDEPHDAKDIYGWSKSLGESALAGMSNSMVLRVSIIGWDNFSNKGLLSWFVNNPEGEKIKGYTDHYWNGITTLEWCKIIHRLINEDNLKSNKIIQSGTKNRYSKYEMLLIFKTVFRPDLDVIPFSTGDNLNRCLNPDFNINNLEDQLIELKNFLKSKNII
ncbi:sugar nucleotide-binding protein [Aurantibacter sp.]|uniref:sugar nucleotide-binding protein n=1 Tax=Aurantibacter sp. TaxID=2807103 RepID=UPI0035C80897